MTTRQYSALLVAALAAITMAGCTTAGDDTEPTAEPAATSGCTPETGAISWGTLSYGENVPVGVQVVTTTGSTTPSGPVTTVETIAVPTEPQFGGDGINMVSDFDSDLRDEWESVLIEDARTTGQVGEDFATDFVLGEQQYVTADPPADGTFVTAVETTPQVMPFTIECDGQEPFSGSVSAVTPGGTASVQLSCAADNSEASENQLAALEYCP
ncbi:hypothetical protein HD599_002337 [Conyzicola lurida]|uniref:Lipoprotein n=1 Tax=Conyzicola lurida TaxID=1172621 RepID=A0A841ANX1_9MICO|nr:hypothetical protein [Conyzicola lurida]MBB5844014.1 hypothetical protein [Conyzicola lurida]